MGLYQKSSNSVVETPFPQYTNGNMEVKRHDQTLVEPRKIEQSTSVVRSQQRIELCSPASMGRKSAVFWALSLLHTCPININDNLVL